MMSYSMFGLFIFMDEEKTTFIFEKLVKSQDLVNIWSISDNTNNFFSPNQTANGNETLLSVRQDLTLWFGY